ncbi:sensor histidine kinase [Streptomyces xanthophaeus]|uniref:sensor histidine kinase n=1 Tax=Streptomyces xanthophaeus TaxID=67385 RepID=UPI0026493A93|nr:histidine kinase [Streptomyces xanthophaeus]WKD33876.1 sensor histidine kinase [Streptomyces xanthophaeus]
MSKMTGWWKNRSSAGKVELYTRWSFHLFVLIEITSFGLPALGAAAEDPSDLALPLSLFLLLCAHAVLCGVLASKALTWVAGRRERPTRSAVTTASLTAAAVLGILALKAAGKIDEPALAPMLVLGLTCFTTGSLVLCMRSVRTMRYVAPVAATGTGVTVLALGLPAAHALGYFLGVLLCCLFFTATSGFSAWLLRTVHELDQAREVQSRLAVAEERLRFGRDLHDVMGRNLAVIALKSELAIQLARRERPEAVEQMIEVQRIAQESQREVRDVVRGYREADLSVELEGARGVLSAAGMDCRVDFRAARGRELPAEVQSALGWVVREATTNILRHGDAHRCLIRLTAAETGSVTLVVENDGAPETPAGPPGSGLAGLRERLAALDGTLQAGPVGDGRFRLLAQIPDRRLQELEVRA